MQVMELNAILAETESSDQVGYLIRAFRHDEKIWSFLDNALNNQTNQLKLLVNQHKLNPGSLGLLAFNKDLIATNYPVNRPSVSVLEECMVNFETFIQHKNPPVTLDDAVKLAIVLIEKYNLTVSWFEVINEIVDRMHLSPSDSIDDLLGTAFGIVVNLINEPDALFHDFLELSQLQWGIELLLHSILCMPISENEMAEKISNVLEQDDVVITEKLLSQLIFVNEHSLAEQVAKLSLDKFLTSELFIEKQRGLFSDIDNAAEKISLYRQLAVISQMAGEFDLSSEMVNKSIHILGLMTKGMRLQQLSLLDQIGKAEDIENLTQEAGFEDLFDPELECDLASLDYLPHGKRVEKSRSHPAAELHESVKLMKTGNPELAKAQCEMVFSQNPSKIDRLVDDFPRFNPNWTAEKAIAKLVDLDAAEIAVTAAKHLLKKNPSSLSANKTAALALITAKNYGEALPLLEMLSVSEKKSTEIDRTLAECYKRVGNYSASYHVCKKLVGSGNASSDDLLFFAESALDYGKPEEVFESTSKVLEIEPDNTRAMTINAKAYMQNGNRELALEYFNKAIETGTDDPKPWIGLAELYEKGDNIRQAVETLRNGMAAMPKNQEIKQKLAELLMETGSATEALPLLGDLAKTSKDVEIKILQAEAMKILGLAEYKDLINRLYTQYPDNSELALAQATELIKEGKRLEAKQVMESHIDLSEPGNQVGIIFADAVVGMDYESNYEPKTLNPEESSRADEIITSYLKNDRDNSRALLLQAEWFQNKGQHLESFEYYSKLIERLPSIDKSLFERIQAGFASSAAFLGKFEIALAAIKQAVESKPEWVGLQKLLARIYALAGEVNEALKQAQVVLEVGPQILDTFLWFVDFLDELGETEEAEEKLKTIIAEHQDEQKLRTKLAEILVKNNKITEAQKIAESMEGDLSPELSDSELVTFAKIFDRIGNDETAKLCLGYRVDREANLSTQLDLAAYHYSKGQFEEAILELDEIEVNDENATLLNCLKADTLVKQGRLQSALDLIQNIGTEVELDVPVNFLSGEWKKLLEASDPVRQMQTQIAFQLGNAEQCRSSALTWLETEPGNVEASIYYFEADLALGGSLRDLMNHNFTLEHSEDPVQCHLTALLMDAMIDNNMALEAKSLFEKNQACKTLSKKAVEIRFSLISGHLAEAERTFDEMIFEFSVMDPAEMVIQIGLTRLLVKAAIALQRWNEALTYAGELATKFGWHASCSMLYLTTITRAKEFQPMADELSVVMHNPRNFLQQIKVDDEINWISTSLSGKNEEEVERWLLRGRMAASTVTENIKAFALITPAEDDAAAMVAALYRNKQVTTAVQVAQKFEDNARVLLELARIQLNKDVDEAIATLNALIAINPLMPMAFVMRAKAYEIAGKIDLAINDFEQAISDWPNENQWRLAAARLWQDYGNNKNAILQLQAAFESDPEDEAISLALGKAILTEGKVEKSIEILRPVIERNPNLYAGWEVMADAFAQNGEMDEALHAARKASDINPNSIKPYLMSGNIYLKNGNMALALDQAKIAVNKNKKDAEAVLFLAKVLMEKGEKRQALATLEMTNQCENVTAQNMIDHVELVKEINGGAYAKDLIASMSSKYPENVELLKMLAVTQKEIGDVQDAEVTAKRALQVEPDEPDLHLFLGTINAESGQLDQAIHHLSQGIMNKTDKMDGYLLLSKVYEQQREFTKALEALKQAMEIAPTDIRSYLAAANLYRNSKDYSSAERILQQAIEIDPNDVAIRRQLGALLALKLVHHSQEASTQS